MARRRAAWTFAVAAGVAAVLLLSAAAGPRAAPSAGEVVRAVVGLLLIGVLASLAGHAKVQELEELLGISAIMTAGFSFVVLGLIAHHPAIGLLSDSVLTYVRPFLPLGLGWIGISIGFRFDVRRLDGLPRGIGPTLLLTSVLPFAAIVGACGLTLLLTDGVGEGTFLRDSILLGTAAVVGVRPAAPSPDRSAADRIAPLVQLQEGCAMIGLVLVAAFFRGGELDAGWQLPAIAWIFVTLGLATALAAIIYAVLHIFHADRQTETAVVMLGAICLASGLASFLRLSPIAVCFLAGALLFNVPAAWKEQVRLALVRLERPIFTVFLVVAGALWRIGAWQGWVLLVLFVAGRAIGKVLGVFLARQRRLGEQLHVELDLSDDEQVRIALAPMGTLALAIVVDAQDLFFGPTVSWMVTTVIGGALATEVLVQLALRRLYPGSYTPAAPGPSPTGLAPEPREATQPVIFPPASSHPDVRRAGEPPDGS